MTFAALVRDVRDCRVCADALPLGPRPILQVDPRARVLVAGQAPGRVAHEAGIPFRDRSGDRLREWMGITEQTFYDPSKIAIVPMAFCYPGTGASGDLAPRAICAETWREKLLAKLRSVELTLVIGTFAHAYHFEMRGKTLTDTVRAWRDYGPEAVPLPHPSPRNQLWLRKNPWFEKELLPPLRRRIRTLL